MAQGDDAKADACLTTVRESYEPVRVSATAPRHRRQRLKKVLR